MTKDHVLVVEDDPNIRKILRIQLMKAEYDVTLAEDGEAALRILRDISPDLVLLDVMMPKMDGFAVCREIRADRRHAHLPIVFLTAKTGPQARVDGLIEGANDYISKPYTQNELLLRIKNLIAWSRAQRHSNPLTGLPGNISIEAEISSRLAGGDFSFLYIDLDNFKAFNDTYSYRAGDEVIKLMARILQEVTSEMGSPDDFVGHVGGDDFVVITRPLRSSTIAAEVISRFDRDILEYYRPEDRERGTVLVENRRGEMEEVPLVGVTIAQVDSDRHQIDHLAMLNDIVAGLKHHGKQQRGSTVVKERRRSSLPPLRTGSEG